MPLNHFDCQTACNNYSFNEQKSKLSTTRSALWLTDIWRLLNDKPSLPEIQVLKPQQKMPHVKYSAVIFLNFINSSVVTATCKTLTEF